MKTIFVPHKFYTNMVRFFIRLLCLALWLPLAPALVAAPHIPATVEVYYSPRGGCTEAIVKALRAAKMSVLVQAYSFTSPPIEDALAAAAKRGVKVQLILDRSNLTQKSSQLAEAVGDNLSIKIDAKHEIAHNKVMILDGETVITGSFNFTHNAEANNAENLLIIHSKELATSYTANWNEHAGHSDLYDGETAAKTKKSERAAPHKTSFATR